MDLFHLIFRGVLLGFILAFLIGPVFFALIRLSLEKGVRPASIFAAGTAASDILALGLAYFLIAGFSENPHYKSILGWTGGIIMIIFGIVDIIKKPIKSTGDTILSNRWYSLFLKGFILNLVNPFVYIFWIGIVASLSIDKTLNGNDHSILLLSMIITVYLTDLLKAWMAFRISHLITDKTLLLISRILGIGLIAFGLRLIWFGSTGR
ncbi:MAG: LysE family transporter [Saprospiraceae bacterium]|nr:LysE family transporter [Saprospiraceae bacterium]MBK9631501.1 LysE family transporter [Saprospiraceae bacterium]